MDNLVDQLLSHLRMQSAIRFSLRITIDKEIPVAAGLGGASSLVASLLLMLNRLWALDMTQAQLMRAALEFGSDVPFFVLGETALAEGRGERLQPFPCCCYHYLLVCPFLECQTGEHFASASLNRSSPRLDLSQLKENFWLSPSYQNAFLPLVLDSYPSIRSLYDLMVVKTATKLVDRVFLSGSGGTLFVVYEQREDAARAYELLRAEIDPNQGTVRLAQGIALSPLVEQLRAKST